MDMSTIGKNTVKPGLPKLSPGDNVRVSFKIKEASRERVQTFPGLIIKITKHNSGGNFTVRRVTSGIGVEHTFPLASPLLDKIEIVRHGKVRRSKLYYIRRLSTKEARLKERRDRITERVSPAVVEDMLTATPEPEAPASESK
jgi:large subunit ribosomal protein L19